MKKSSIFNEAKPRTPRGEARQRENDAARAIEDLLQINDEGKFKQNLTEHYGIVPGSPKYDQIMSIWREYRSGRS
jgi:hypothetical protein